MKTTIDIPEPLYRAAKIRTIETGRTLKDLVVTSLERELEQIPDARNPRKRLLKGDNCSLSLPVSKPQVGLLLNLEIETLLT